MWFERISLSAKLNFLYNSFNLRGSKDRQGLETYYCHQRDYTIRNRKKTKERFSSDLISPQFVCTGNWRTYWRCLSFGPAVYQLLQEKMLLQLLSRLLSLMKDCNYPKSFGDLFIEFVPTNTKTISVFRRRTCNINLCSDGANYIT